VLVGEVWRHRTRGDTRALPCREAGFGTVGLDLSLMRRGTRSIVYRQCGLHRDADALIGYDDIKVTAETTTKRRRS
jgi:hypothetical protein